MQQKHCLNQKELAGRWGMSHRTLERWRYSGEGPAYLKLGGRVVYRLADVEKFEESQLQKTIAPKSPILQPASAPRRLTANPLRAAKTIQCHQQTRWARS